MTTLIDTAKYFGLDEKIVAAIVYQESKGNPFAFREERGFFNQYLASKTSRNLSGYVPPPHICSLETEIRARSFSWGLMQVMGETARFLGFKGNYLSELTLINVNLKIGCQYLKYLLDLKNGNYQAAVAAYNGAKNPNATGYDEKILSHITDGRYLGVLNL